MSLSEKELEVESLNVLSLFHQRIEIEAKNLIEDPCVLELEVECVEDVEKLTRTAIVAHEAQQPEAAMYVLDKQLDALKETLSRIKFYLGELEEIIPQ
jgi:hypothetical protein